MKRLLVLALLAASWTWAADPPTARLVPGTGTIILSRLPAILDNDEVIRELESGLTNTFVVHAVLRRVGRSKVRGGASIRIRYDLWDEVYQVNWTDGDGLTHHTVLDDREGLAGWWRSAELAVALGIGDQAGADWKLKIELALLPFSQAEQDATREWLEQPAESSPGTTNPGGLNTLTTSYGTVLDVLVATSLQPDEVLRFDWNIPVTTE